MPDRSQISYGHPLVSNGLAPQQTAAIFTCCIKNKSRYSSTMFLPIPSTPLLALAYA